MDETQNQNLCTMRPSTFLIRSNFIDIQKKQLHLWKQHQQENQKSTSIYSKT